MAFAFLANAAVKAVAKRVSDHVVATADEAEVQDLSICAKLANAAYLNEVGRKEACKDQSLTFIDGVKHAGDFFAAAHIHGGAMLAKEVLAGVPETGDGNIDGVVHAATTVVLAGSSEAGDDDFASWFLASDSRAFYLVFEGTSNAKDALVDLAASPSDDLQSCHNGFQLGCSPRLNKRLYKTIRSKLDGSTQDLYVIGHSLGGAYAMIFAQKYLDEEKITYSGSRRVFMFGSPKVFNGAVHGPPTVKGSATIVVNADDIVPRLLGQTGEVSKYIYDWARTSLCSGRFTQQGQLINAGDTNALSQYVHPEGIQLFVLRNEEIQKPMEFANEGHLELTLSAIKIFASDDMVGEVLGNHSMANYLDNIQVYGKKPERAGLVRAMFSCARRQRKGCN